MTWLSISRSVEVVTGVVELSRIGTVISATDVVRLLSEKSETRSVSVPSVLRSSLKRWEKEKEPDGATTPEPVSSPLSRSSESMPERVQ